MGLFGIALVEDGLTVGRMPRSPVLTLQGVGFKSVIVESGYMPRDLSGITSLVLSPIELGEKGDFHENRG